MTEKMIKYTGGVSIRIDSVFLRPKVHYKRGLRGGDTRLKIHAPHFHAQKPDCDNLAKFVGDCLSGLAFRDDCQICDLSVHKRWSHIKTYTKVTLKYLNKKHAQFILKSK